MKEIDEKATSILLASLDNEIDVKCIELKEKQKETKLKKIFFISCAFVLLIFFLQMFFSIFNVNYVLSILIYQVVALLLVVPVVFNVYKGGVSK